MRYVETESNDGIEVQYSRDSNILPLSQILKFKFEFTLKLIVSNMRITSLHGTITLFSNAKFDTSPSTAHLLLSQPSKNNDSLNLTCSLNPRHTPRHSQ